MTVFAAERAQADAATIRAGLLALAQHAHTHKTPMPIDVVAALCPAATVEVITEWAPELLRAVRTCDTAFWIDTCLDRLTGAA